MLSHRFWQARLGSAENVVGSTIDSMAPSEVVGVLPASFRFPGADGDVWEPHTLFPGWDALRGPRGDAS